MSAGEHMSGHTPGAWRIVERDGRPYAIEAAGAHLRLGVVLWGGIARRSSDEGKANARLLAAAPALLDALRPFAALADASELGSVPDDRPLYAIGTSDAFTVGDLRRARAALAAAVGDAGKDASHDSSLP
jgi:hypothetical protein